MRTESFDSEQRERWSSFLDQWLAVATSATICAIQDNKSGPGALLYDCGLLILLARMRRLETPLHCENWNLKVLDKVSCSIPELCFVELTSEVFPLSCMVFRKHCSGTVAAEYRPFLGPQSRFY